MFRETLERHAQLKTKLMYDEISQQKFISYIITFYLQEDADMLKLVEKMKDKEGISSNKKKTSKKDIMNMRKYEKRFGLNKNDIENIFDFIEEESSDL